MLFFSIAAYSKPQHTHTHTHTHESQVDCSLSREVVLMGAFGVKKSLERFTPFVGWFFVCWLVCLCAAQSSPWSQSSKDKQTGLAGALLSVRTRREQTGCESELAVQ